MNSARIAYVGLIKMHSQEIAADGHFRRTRELSNERIASIDKDITELNSSLRHQALQEIREEAMRLLTVNPPA